MAESDSLPIPNSGIRGFVGRPFWLEARSTFEIRELRQSKLWHGEGFPAGHGRPALIMPGFLAGSRSTAALEHVMREAGWLVRAADVGRNAGPAHRSCDQGREDMQALADETGQKVTLIGHSRGGQFAKILSIQKPELVRQVVGLGTPLQVKYPMFFVMKVPAEILDKAWRLGAFGPVDKAQEDATEALRFRDMPPGIEFVSIWSRSDGIVDWRLSQAHDAANIEVDASHLGILSSVQGISGVAKALSRQLIVDCPVLN